MEVRPVVAELFHSDGQKETDSQKDWYVEPKSRFSHFCERV